MTLAASRIAEIRERVASGSCDGSDYEEIVYELLGGHAALKAENAVLRKALDNLVNAKALKGVREQVAGWNGEGRPDAPYERHPSRLGATMPKTNCGAVYELDDAMSDARAALAQQEGQT